ncbi:MAG TPA: hypothetical protein VIR45_03135 [Kiloniellaceae bacterium]
MSGMADTPKAPRKAASPDPKEGWLVREIVGEFILAPLVRGALWLVLHAALLVKRLLLP